MTIPEIDSQIAVLVEMFNDFIAYNDAIAFTDENNKSYITSDTLISNTEISNNTAIQALEELKKDSLTQYVHTVIQDTTIFNLCFELYGEITDENIEKLIIANDFLAYDRTDIDPNSPIIKRGVNVMYYK